MPKLTLASNALVKIVSLCMLYVAQGITHGFLATTLVAYLVGRGLKSEDVAETLAVAALPWAFKWVWGPIIDRFSSSALGRRRPWVLSAQAMMIITTLLLLLVGDLATNLKLVAWIILAHNVFKSLQDVSVDALAIDILAEHERGRANGLMYGCSYLGALIGINLTYVVTRVGIDASICVMAVLLTLIMMIPILLREREGEKQFPWSDGKAMTVDDDEEGISTLALFKSLGRAFSLRSTILCAITAVMLYIAYNVMAPLGAVLMIQKLGWSEEFYSQLATVGSIFAMAGSMGGGFLADRLGHRRSVILAMTGLSVLWIVAALNIPWWHVAAYHMVTACFGGLFMGFMASSYFSLAMDVSWKKVGGSQFSTYMALLNLSMVIAFKVAAPLESAATKLVEGGLGESLAGMARFAEAELLPYALIYVAMALFHLLVMIPLMFIDPEQTARTLGHGDDSPPAATEGAEQGA